MPKTRCPLPKGQACTCTYLYRGYITTMSIHTVCRLFPHTNTHTSHMSITSALCRVDGQHFTEQVEIFLFTGWIYVELCLLFCRSWKEISSTLNGAAGMQMEVYHVCQGNVSFKFSIKGLKLCSSRAARIKKMERIDCTHRWNPFI